MKVVLENFQFLGDSRGGGGNPAPSGENDATASPERHSPPARTSPARPAPPENLDEDVPF